LVSWTTPGLAGESPARGIRIWVSVFEGEDDFKRLLHINHIKDTKSRAGKKQTLHGHHESTGGVSFPCTRVKDFQRKEEGFGG
jgi:hypothetical protein